MELGELELRIPVPGPLGLLKCGKLELGTLLLKLAGDRSEWLWLPKCVELEPVELESGVPAPELFGFPKYFKLEVGTQTFSGLISDIEAALFRFSNCPEVKPGMPFSGLMGPGIPVPVLLVRAKYLERGDPEEPDELLLTGLV